MIYIGIDPGASGAIAAIDENYRIIGTYKMPLMDSPVAGKKMVNAKAIDYFMENITQNLLCVATIEQVSAMPGQGVTSMFSFGMSAGIAIGVTSLYVDELNFVRPQVWKKHFGLIKADKEASILKAREVFNAPEIKHDGIAEALLIAAYSLEKTTL